MFQEIRKRVLERPAVSLAVVSAVVHLISLIRHFGAPGGIRAGPDALFLEHAGWYVTQGGVPYVEIWDVKPPLSIETTAVLSLLTGGNMLALHVLATVLTVVLGVGITLLVFRLVADVTDDEFAGLVAGLFILAYPGFHYFAGQGFSSKFFALFFGLLAVHLAQRGRTAVAAAVATLSPAYWQFGLVFPAIVLGYAALDRSPRTVGRSVGAMGTVTVVVLGPIVLWDALVPMVGQVIFTGFVVPESNSVFQRLARGFLFFGYLPPLVLLGTYGLARAGIDDPESLWWALVGTGWFAVQSLFLDFDAYPDLIGTVVFVGVGVGFLYDRLRKTNRRVVFASVAVLVVVSAVFLGTFGVFTRPLGQEQNDDVVLRQALITVGEKLTGRSVTTPPARGAKTRANFSLPTMEEIYWQKLKLDTCHYRLSNTEKLWIEATNTSYMAETCGPNSWQELVALANAA